MKKLLLPGLLGLVMLASASARVWTDVKGRKIDAEYVAQTADAVVLKLKSGKEVTVAFDKLSRGDLAYLIELETAGAKKENTPMKDGEEKEGGTADADSPPPVLAGDWSKPVPKEAVLSAPLEVQQEKRGDYHYFSSPNFRVVANGRLSSKAAETILEACELTKVYCESLPFQFKHRFPPVDGKFEIHTTGKTEDWVKVGMPETSRSTFNPNNGQLNICLELFGLAESGRGSDDRMRTLAGQMILHVSGSMLPEVYERNLMDWFKEGFPNLMNCAVYEKGRLDFTGIVGETKDLLLGKGRSGQKPLFEKQVEMRKLPDLITTTVGGVADEEGRRRFLGQSVIVMAYLMFMEDGGKATGMRNGLKYLHEFKLPKTIPAKSQEEFEEKKAALLKEAQELGEKSTAMMFRERPWEDVEAEITALWKEQGLKLDFSGEEKK